MRELTRELRVGTCCGKCLPEAKAALNSCVAQSATQGHRSSGMSSPSFFPSPAPEFAT